MAASGTTPAFLAAEFTLGEGELGLIKVQSRQRSLNRVDGMQPPLHRLPRIGEVCGSRRED